MSYGVAVGIALVRVVLAINVFVVIMAYCPPVVSLWAFQHCLVILIFLFVSTRYHFHSMGHDYGSRLAYSLPFFCGHMINIMLFGIAWSGSPVASDLLPIVLQTFACCCFFYIILPFVDDDSVRLTPLSPHKTQLPTSHRSRRQTHASDHHSPLDDHKDSLV
jgi:hypothetical protein